MLDDKARRPSLQGAAWVGPILVHRQEYDLNVGVVLFEQVERIDTIEPRHADISHDNVRTKFFSCRQERVTVFNCADQLKIVGEKAL